MQSVKNDEAESSHYQQNPPNGEITEKQYWYDPEIMDTKLSCYKLRLKLKLCIVPVYRTNSNFLNNVCSILQILRLVFRHPKLLEEKGYWLDLYRNHRQRIFHC